MRSCLGVSLGTANLVAVADGRATVRPAAVTVPSGLSVTGFVERVGDPVPLVLADHSVHRPETLAAAAVEDLTRWASPQRRPDLVTVAVPAHWSGAAIGAFRSAAPHVTVVSEVSAAVTALQASPGLPTRGVIALCDLGAGGSSITLVDAGNGFAAVGDTVRLDVLSGDGVDGAVLQHVLAEIETDPGGTAHVAALSGLRDRCRAAKERLSVETATGLVWGRTTVRLTRPELEALIDDAVGGFVDAVVTTLHRYGVSPAALAAVATVGGGARIPLVTERLSEALQRPVITTPGAALAAAAGAELLARRGAEPVAQTVSVAAPMTAANATVAAPVTPLAWSAEADDPGAHAVFEDETVYATAYARPDVHFEPDEIDEADVEPLGWYRRPGVLFAAAACLAAVATTGLVLTAQVGPVEADASDIAAPVATAPVQAPTMPVEIAPPPPPVTETVAAAPAPRVVQAAPQSPAPQRVVAKQAAPQAVPRPAAPATETVAAPAPSTTPTPTPTPSSTPTPTPSSTPTPTPSSTPTPTPTPTSTPAPTSTPPPVTSQPVPVETPTATQEPAPAETPVTETPATETPATECVPTAELAC